MSNATIGPAFGADPDYGPYRAAPGDPRTPEPPPFDSLTEQEKRAELATLERTELVDMVLSLAESVVEWENRARRVADILGVKV